MRHQDGVARDRNCDFRPDDSQTDRPLEQPTHKAVVDFVRSNESADALFIDSSKAAV